MDITKSEVLNAQPVTATSEYVTDYLPVDHENHNIFLRGWIHAEVVDQQPIILAHNLGESSQNYQNLLNHLYHAGYQSCSFDFRGHGQSASSLLSSTGVDWFVHDMLQVVSWVKFKTQLKPIVVAEGFAGLVAFKFQEKWGDLIDRLVVADMPIYLEKNIADEPFWIKWMSEILPRTPGPYRAMPEPVRNLMAHCAKPPKMNILLIRELYSEIVRFCKGKVQLNVPCLVIINKFINTIEEEDLSKFFFKNSVKSKFKWETLNSETASIFSDNGDSQLKAVELVNEWIQKAKKV